MSKFKHEIGRFAFQVIDGEALAYSEGFVESLAVEDVLKLAEFAAAAYHELEGEEYEHAEYDKGLVAVVKAGEHVIPKRSAVLPLFYDKMESVHDDGSGLERDCE